MLSPSLLILNACCACAANHRPNSTTQNLNRCGISPKKLLIPMSFATVLGGTCTLIGTSTNLVVAGLQLEKYGAKNPEFVFGFFTITPWGLPYAIWGERAV